MPSKPKLAIFDIDGTLRRVRDPWIHLHQYFGVAEQASDFVARWKQGEISYEEWANLDASLWRGKKYEIMIAALNSNPLRSGAKDLVNWFSSRNIPTVAVSTGLNIFNDITAQEVGLCRVICNDLKFENDMCTGIVNLQVKEDNKRIIMDELLSQYSVICEEVVAFGDGTADIPILQSAGLSIAICPTNDLVRNCVDYIVDAEPIDAAISFLEVRFPSCL